MKRNISLPLIIAIMIGFSACTQNTTDTKVASSADPMTDTATIKIEIGAMLDSFNVAAANAEYERYFDYFTEDAVYMGTDATEHWDKAAFKVWAKPHFDKKRTWNFTAVERHIFPGKGGDIAWFDELLDAPFAKMCRGSGVVVKQNNMWKVQQYVLSMTVPNSLGDSIMKIKSPVEDSLLNKLRSKE